MSDDGLREGEVALPFDPAASAGDAGIVFIGVIRSPWRERATCPHNLREARERGGGATVEVDPAFRAGLSGLEDKRHIVLLYWLDQARRDIIVARPRHAGKTSGVFALRSPVRPNPIGLATVRVLAMEVATGKIEIEAIDCLDGTWLVDIKPYIPGVDDAT
jgi:tRNA-Thr(GGU) m(6)t(6)A37 methyltransferase TsaA